MRIARVSPLVLCSTYLALVANVAFAQGTPVLGENQWYFSPMVSYGWDDKDRLGDPGFGGSLGIGNHFLPHWAAELNLLGNRFDGYYRTNQYGAGLDFLGMGDVNKRFVPYAVMGVEYLWSNVTEATPTSLPRGRDDDNPATSLGFGFMTGSRVLFRAEARARYEFAEPNELLDYFVNVGLVVPIGQREVAPTDSDGDGVPDPQDKCPGTPPGTPVDSTGCEPDSDHDGVVDSRDKCPGTPAGHEVDAQGCERVMDSDGDGVPDPQDKCPGTPRGVRVDYQGCEIKEEIKLPGVNFEFDSARLTADSSETLDNAVTTLKRNSDISVECSGHTDSTGADAYNQKLSEQRAHSVCEYLATHGIERARLTEHGYGETKPIADNSTEAGRAENRRVVLRITSGA
jgi:OOP family OmpA-OmpF porin